MTADRPGTMPAAQPTWRVTGQQETTEIDPSGSAVRGWRVFYTTTTGTQGSVFVPQGSYNRQNVAAMVAAAAGETMAIAGLTG